MSEQQSEQSRGGMDSRQLEDWRRSVPQSSLDMNMQLTDTMWGSPEINTNLRSFLRKEVPQSDEQGNIKKNPEGKTITEPRSNWDLLAFYTRDLRLANLSTLNGEFEYCQYYLDLAGDLLSEGMAEPFGTAISRAATILELSQSKGGFLRKRMSTLTSESSHQEIAPPKKRLFGKSKEGFA